MKTPKHTPGKLKALGAGYLENEHDRLIAKAVVLKGKSLKEDERLNDEAEANAHRLAHCWNMHDELTALVACLLENLELSTFKDPAHLAQIIQEGKDLLAKAKGRDTL